jgi:hypothetical protein
VDTTYEKTDAAREFRQPAGLRDYCTAPFGPPQILTLRLQHGAARENRIDQEAVLERAAAFGASAVRFWHDMTLPLPNE